MKHEVNKPMIDLYEQIDEEFKIPMILSEYRVRHRRYRYNHKHIYE
jgi:hypothetical protein